MTSEKQIAANRENAKKCTGPTSEAGKAISSQNALKTGIDSKSEVMPCESRQEYEALTADFHRDYAPVGSTERALVDTLIKTEWLNRRYMSTRAAIWERGFEDTGSRDMGKVFLREQNAFVRADRCHNSAIRNFDKALVRLTVLQAKRNAIASEARRETAQPAVLPPEPGIATEPLNPEFEPEMVSLLHFSGSPATLHPNPPISPDPTDAREDLNDRQPPIAA